MISQKNGGSTTSGKVQKFPQGSFSPEILEAVEESDAEKLDSLLRTQKLDNSALNYLLIEAIKSHSTYRDNTIVQLLLQKGASCNTEDSDGKSVLMLAAEKGYTEIIDDILNYGPDIDARDKYGKNALFYAIESNCENSDIASRLIEKGINVDCQANDKSTPLLKAIEKGYLEIARLLLKNKAFTHYVNDNGDTLLHIAARKKSRGAMELLINHGADPYKKNKSNQTVFDLCQEDSLARDIEELYKKHKTQGNEYISKLLSNDPAKEVAMEQGKDSGFETIVDIINKGTKHIENKGEAETNKNFPLTKKGSREYSHTSAEDDRKPCQIIEQSTQSRPVEYLMGQGRSNEFDQQETVQMKRTKSNSNSNSGNKGTFPYGNQAQQQGSGKYQRGNQNQKGTQQFENKYVNNQTANSGGGRTPTSSQDANKFANNSNTKLTTVNEFQLHKQEQGERSNQFNFQGGNLLPQNVYPTYYQPQQQQQPQQIFTEQMSHYGNKNEGVNVQYTPNTGPQNVNFSGFFNNGGGGALNEGYPGGQGMSTQQRFNQSGQYMPPQGQYQGYQGQFQGQIQQQPQLIQSQFPFQQGQFFQMPNGQINFSQGYTSMSFANKTIKTNKHHIDLRNVHETSFLKFQADNESLQLKIEDNNKVIRARKAQDEELKSKLDAVMEEGNKNIKYELELNEKLKNTQSRIEELEQKVAQLEKEKAAEATVVTKAVATESLISTSATLQHLKSNVRDARLIDYLPKYDDQIINKLHKEILDFEMWVDNENKEQRPVVEALYANFKALINKLFPNAEIALYGSYATGLNLPSNGIDVSINLRDSSFQNPASQIMQALKGKDWVEEVRISQLKIGPIVKIIASKAYLNKKMDVTILESKHNGMACVALVRDYLAAYPKVLRPLVLILKQFLLKTNLAARNQGGLNSYGLILMIVAYFQRTNEHESQNLGSALLGFFFNYGFDYLMHIVPGIPDGKKFIIPHPNLQLASYYNGNPLLIVQDPINEFNNVTRNTSIMKIKSIFAAALVVSQQSCVCDFHDGYLDVKKALNVPTTHNSTCTSVLQRIFSLSNRFPF